MDTKAIFEEYGGRYPALITTDEAAEISRAPVQTIYEWSSRGLLDQFKFKVGRRILFGRDEFLQFLFGGT